MEASGEPVVENLRHKKAPILIQSTVVTNKMEATAQYLFFLFPPSFRLSLQLASGCTGEKFSFVSPCLFLEFFSQLISLEFAAIIAGESAPIVDTVTLLDALFVFPLFDDCQMGV